MQCLLPHEASTTWPSGTEPWVSIQLCRRRPYAVDGLAISSQSPFRVVGENSPLANRSAFLGGLLLRSLHLRPSRSLGSRDPLPCCCRQVSPASRPFPV